MSAYDDNVEVEENTRFTGRGTDRTDGKKRGLFQNAPCQLALALVLLIVMALSITCVVLVCVFHWHLLFLCSYSEFMLLVVLQGVISLFVIYHVYHIYKYFAPSHTDDDDGKYDKVDEDEEEEYEEEENDIENSKAMRIVIFLLKFLCLVVSIVAFLGLIAYTIGTITYQQLTLPQVSGAMQFPGLLAETQVYREPNGVIHIVAQNDDDLFFAQGVVIAQERMWQLEFHRRLGRGELSEILGSKVVSIDKWSRTLGFRRAALRDWENISATSKKVLQQYTAGINAYIAKNVHLAPEFNLIGAKPQNWEPADVLTYSKLMSWDLNGNLNVELKRLDLLSKGVSRERIEQLLPFYPNDGPTVLNASELKINATQEEIDALWKKFTDDTGAYQPPTSENRKPIEKRIDPVLNKYFFFGRSQQASNNWVIGSKLSLTGKPMLANDPHLRLTAPGVWILMHIQSPNINAMGATFAGTPGIVIGSNDYISWGVTNAAADVQDLYAMTEVGGGNNGTQYYHGGTIKTYTLYNETILVKGEEAVELTVRESVYGPVVNDIVSVNPNVAALSLKMVPLAQVDTTIDAFTNIYRAKNWDEFRTALKSYVSPAQNFIFADRAGNIGYMMPGLIPIRKTGHSGRYPVKGDGNWDYTEFIPFEELPVVYNPEKGYVASANNRIVPDGYKYSITLDYEMKYRAQRIVEMIEERKVYNNMTITDMTDIQTDVKSKLFDDLSFVFSLIKGNMTEENENWVEAVINWHGYENETTEAAVFEAWFNLMLGVTEATLNERVQARYSMFIRTILQNSANGIEDPACLAQNKTCLEFAKEAFENATQYLDDNFGGTAPLWGSDVHEARLEHVVLKDTLIRCLASKTVNIFGGRDTVNVADPNEELAVEEGVSYRQVIDLNRQFNATDSNDLFIIPLGQSGNWLSKNYDNFLEMWRKGEYLSMKAAGFDVGTTLVLTP